MLANMANSLIEHKRIKTTLPKAKALRVYVEPLITKSKKDTMHSRRTVFSYLNNKEAIKELFGEIRPRILERPGGYTRILKLGPRQGDNAEMALIELVDFNEFAPGKAPTGGSESKKRRRRKSSGKKSETAAVAAEGDETFIEKVADRVEDAVDKLEDAVENAGEKLEEIADKVEDAVEDIVEKVEDAVDGDDDKK